MPTITEIRQKYPQYSDMSDQQLADALHSKFYADIPKTDFYGRVGLGSQDPAVPTPAQVNAEAKANEGGGPLRYLDNLVRQGANALTFGFADELSAGASQLTGIGPTASAPSYDAALAQERARDKGFEQSNPVAATGAQIAGAMLAPAPGLAWAAKAPGIVAKAGRSAAVAAPMGALTGFGQGEGGIENRLEKAQSDGLLAAGIGAALPPVAIGAGKVANVVKDALAPLTASGRERLARRELAEGVTGAKMGADEFQPAVQKAIENIDATQQAARQINEPLGQFEGYMAKIMGDNPGVWAGDRWVDPATGATIMKPYQPTTGVAIGTPNALGAEKQARLKSPDQFIDRDARNNEALTAAVNTLDSGDPNIARQAFADRGAAKVQAAQGALSQAEAELAKKEALAPKFVQGVEQRGKASVAQAEQRAAQAQAEMGALTRETIDAAPNDFTSVGRESYDLLQSYRQQDRAERDALYAAIDQKPIVRGTGQMVNDAAEIVGSSFERAPAPMGKMAERSTLIEVPGLKARFGEELSVGDLMEIHREANRVAGSVKGSDPVLMRKALQLAAQADQAIRSVGGGVAEKWAAAQKNYKENYVPRYKALAGQSADTMGNLGDGTKLAPSQGVSRWIAPDESLGDELAKQYRLITRDDPKALENVRNHFGDMVAREAVKDGVISGGKIGAILNRYRAALAQFPEVRDGLTRLRVRANDAKGNLDAALAGKKAASSDAEKRSSGAAKLVSSELSKMQKAVELARRGVEQTEKGFSSSLPGVFASHDHDRAVSKILLQPDPAQSVRELMEYAAEVGPEAMSGIKQAFTDDMKRRITQLSRATAEGGGPGAFKQSAAQLEKLIGKNGTYRRALEALYNPQELRLLDNVRTEMSRTALLGNRASSGSDSVEKAGRVLPKTIASGMMNLLSLGAASSYGLFAGLSVQTAGALRQYNRGQITEIVNRAMLDPDLAKAMLSRATEENTRKALKLFEKVANASPRAGLAAAAVTD